MIIWPRIPTKVWDFVMAVRVSMTSKFVGHAGIAGRVLAEVRRKEPSLRKPRPVTVCFIAEGYPRQRSSGSPSGQSKACVNFVSRNAGLSGLHRIHHNHLRCLAVEMRRQIGALAGVAPKEGVLVRIDLPHA